MAEGLEAGLGWPRTAFGLVEQLVWPLSQVLWLQEFPGEAFGWVIHMNTNHEVLAISYQTVHFVAAVEPGVE